uniref:Uncharacterized protein n=1 Tax=Vespula pensylvanica TaxID=30213 RepID=A0A834UB64_VESPE|nr:hypothetical protein H0235_007046 [Vespula pensylvanica]
MLDGKEKGSVRDKEGSSTGGQRTKLRRASLRTRPPSSSLTELTFFNLLIQGQVPREIATSTTFQDSLSFSAWLGKPRKSSWHEEKAKSREREKKKWGL